MSERYKPPMHSRREVERLLTDAGRALNVNNGRRALTEDVLCRVTTLCVELLCEMDDRERVLGEI